MQLKLHTSELALFKFLIIYGSASSIAPQLFHNPIANPSIHPNLHDECFHIQLHCLRYSSPHNAIAHSMIAFGIPASVSSHTDTEPVCICHLWCTLNNKWTSRSSQYVSECASRPGNTDWAFFYMYTGRGQCRRPPQSQTTISGENGENPR